MPRAITDTRELKILDKIVCFYDRCNANFKWTFSDNSDSPWRLEGETFHQSLGLSTLIISYKLGAHHNGKNLRWGVSNSWVCSQNLSLTSCVTVGKWLNLSEFQLLIWKMGIRIPTSPGRLQVKSVQRFVTVLTQAGITTYLFSRASGMLCHRLLFAKDNLYPKSKPSAHSEQNAQRVDSGVTPPGFKSPLHRV